MIEYWNTLSELIRVMIIAFSILTIIVGILYIFDKEK